jgi:hypothetical protein
VAIRLEAGNNGVLEYLLLPTTAMTWPKIRFVEMGVSRFDGCRFATFAQLTSAITSHIVVQGSGWRGSSPGRRDRHASIEPRVKQAAGQQRLLDGIKRFPGASVLYEVISRPLEVALEFVASNVVGRSVVPSGRFN